MWIWSVFSDISNAGYSDISMMQLLKILQNRWFHLRVIPNDCRYHYIKNKQNFVFPCVNIVRNPEQYVTDISSVVIPWHVSLTCGLPPEFYLENYQQPVDDQFTPDDHHQMSVGFRWCLRTFALNNYNDITTM